MRCLSKALQRPKAPRPQPTSTAIATQRCTAPRCYSTTRSAVSPLSAPSRRPQYQSRHLPTLPSLQSRRTIFIQTEPTPNTDALKFKPNTNVLPDSFPSTFLEYTTPRSTLSPPHPSPLAAELMNVDGVRSVFYGKDYITITKDAATPWAHVKPEVFSLITEAVTNGKSFVNVVAAKEGEEGQGSSASEADAVYDPADQEVVDMILELLETRIRPAIQEDGGDIEFRGFDAEGQVLLKLRGACRTCDSSTVTLKNGIESMLMHYIEEVKGVRQVLDPEEEIAMAEFAKFEEKLKAKQGAEATAAA
ncbi:hypothetical protein B0A48_06322 [Cryoendolithus antarcticus]|uniref:Scaffold protein Nfu/NifU N-terminal domain-containing protein n=1 Tax=Cryoendolithus antarcticus TaxID=1507870 RepID=A0A1V8TB96_9PEZI|nr:hypothetical protein B0A48_06322 [Cryoendolithus antarcticus]